jgi:hypothetical protein
MFIGMWCFCDDAGRHPASAVRLKMEVFPGDDVSKDQIGEWVKELIDHDLLDEYEVSGVPYWEVTGWSHQRIDQPYIRYPDRHGNLTGGVARRLGGRQRQLAYAKLVERDGEKCRQCGAIVNLSVDHVIPISKGGGNGIDNLQLLCKICNSEKHAKLPAGCSHVTRRVLAGDAPPETERNGNGREWKGKEPYVDVDERTETERAVPWEEVYRDWFLPAGRAVSKDDPPRLSKTMRETLMKAAYLAAARYGREWLLDACKVTRTEARTNPPNFLKGVLAKKTGVEISDLFDGIVVPEQYLKKPEQKAAAEVER